LTIPDQRRTTSVLRRIRENTLGVAKDAQISAEIRFAIPPYTQ
jgi:hypothetical protein